MDALQTLVIYQIKKHLVGRHNQKKHAVTAAVSKIKNFAITHKAEIAKVVGAAVITGAVVSPILLYLTSQSKSSSTPKITPTITNPPLPEKPASFAAAQDFGNLTTQSSEASQKINAFLNQVPDNRGKNYTGLFGRNPLTEEEHNAVSDYAAGYFVLANAALRKELTTDELHATAAASLDGDHLDEVRNAFANREVRRVNNILDHLPSATSSQELPEDTVVYRRTSTDDGLGDVYHEKGFLSTSFVNRINSTSVTRFRLRLLMKKGQKGLFLDDHREEEWLMGPGLKFKKVQSTSNPLGGEDIDYEQITD